MSYEERERQAETSEHWSVISRRTLLKAGWTAPVIMTVAPAVAFAASGAPGHGSTPVGPTGTKTPQSGNPSTSNPTSTNNPGTPSTQSPSGASAPAGVPEQSSQGPQPARINRGFTG